MERMAGGRKRAQIIFYVLLVIVIGLSFKPVWDSVGYVIGKLSFASPLMVAITALLFLVIAFASMFAILTLIAAVPAQFMRSILDTAFRIRLNDTFIALFDVLRKAEREELNKEQIHQLLSDTEWLYQTWQRSKTNIFVRWIMPNYFKKDVTKWKLVDKDAKLEKHKK
jgi:hypothetical protein